MKRKSLENDMDSLSTTITVPAGMTLCREGGLAREAMLIVDGTAEVTRGGEMVATVRTGDLVGELALDNEDHRRTATVTATTDCTVAVMSVYEFAELKRTSERFANLLDATVTARS